MSQLASYLITNDLQIAKFSSQVSWLASYLIRPPPLIHFLLLASSTLHPLAFPPISSDMPSRFHCLISLFLPNISMLKCPRAIDTHGEPARSCHLLRVHPVPSHHPLSLGFCTGCPISFPASTFPSHRLLSTQLSE